jgi:hypothetical protein
MLKFHESLISAHHNYLVNRMLTPGFLVGDPNSREDFWFLADMVPPGAREPRIYARLYDSQALFLVEIRLNKIVENPSGCVYQVFPGGFRISYSPGDPLLMVDTESFANGYLTRLKGRLHDKEGQLRMENFYDSVQVFDESMLSFRRPYLTE